MIRFMGRKHTKGDTLVEVSLAIGIFSMVAIAAVAVINGSATSSQASLEGTITREEIDGQAEAIRFIQSAYVAGGEIDENNPTKYASLWRTISSRAIDLTGLSESDKDAILKYNPVSCQELYNSNNNASYESIFKQKAFLINTRAMSSGDPNKIVITTDKNGSLFKSAVTYPRIIYKNADNESDADSIYDPGADGKVNIEKAEGLYVIGVRDEEGTIIVTDFEDEVTVKSAYIDFYIRSCWFTPNAGRASTISTVIRLYDPDVISINKHEHKGVLIRYVSGASDATGTTPSQYVLAGKSATPVMSEFERPGFKFKGWDSNGDGKVDYKVNDDGTISDTYTAPINLTSNTQITLTAVWKRVYSVTYYDTNGTTVLCSEEKEADSGWTFRTGCSKKPTNPDPNKQVFQGWSEDKINGRDPLYNDGDDIVTSGEQGRYNVKLYPVWRVEIVFNNYEWKSKVNNSPNVGSGESESGCNIFNVNRPTNGDYCRITKGNRTCSYPRETLVYGTAVSKAGYLYKDANGVVQYQASKPSIWPNCYVKKGKNQCTTTSLSLSYGKSGGNTAPMDGYLVRSKAGVHIETFENGINLQGYCNNKNVVDEGVYYEIGKNDTFELSAKMNTAGMLTHPSGGSANISIGPLSAIITNGKVSYSCNGGSNSTTFTTNQIVRLKITKYGNTYSMYVNDSQLGQCTVPATGNVTVGYSMKHGTHNCNAVFNVQLTDIQMKRVIK